MTALQPPLSPLVVDADTIDRQRRRLLQLAPAAAPMTSRERMPRMLARACYPRGVPRFLSALGIVGRGGGLSGTARR